MFVRMRLSAGRCLSSVSSYLIVWCQKTWDTLKIIYSLFVFNSLSALDISACLRVANTIQNETFSAGIADYILKNKKISVGNISIVHQVGENVLGDIFQFGPFCEEDNLLLLRAWFDTRAERMDSPAIIEDSVGRLINHINFTEIDSKIIIGVLGMPGSRFSNSERCR